MAMKIGADVNVSDIMLRRNVFPDCAALHPGYVHFTKPYQMSVWLSLITPGWRSLPSAQEE